MLWQNDPFAFAGAWLELPPTLLQSRAQPPMQQAAVDLLSTLTIFGQMQFFDAARARQVAFSLPRFGRVLLPIADEAHSSSACSRLLISGQKGSRDTSITLSFALEVRSPASGEATANGEWESLCAGVASDGSLSLPSSDAARGAAALDDAALATASAPLCAVLSALATWTLQQRRRPR